MKRIRAREVRVIDEDGGQLGVMQPFEAMRLARERVWIWWRFRPRRILPFAKLPITANSNTSRTRKPTSSARAAVARSFKEVKFRPATAEHDFQVRKNQIIRSSAKGTRFAPMIFHRGREMAPPGSGPRQDDAPSGEIGEHCQIETMPRMERKRSGCAFGAQEGCGHRASQQRPGADERLAEIRTWFHTGSFTAAKISKKGADRFQPATTHGEDSKRCHAIPRSPS